MIGGCNTADSANHVSHNLSSPRSPVEFRLIAPKVSVIFHRVPFEGVVDDCFDFPAPERLGQFRGNRCARDTQDDLVGLHFDADNPIDLLEFHAHLVAKPHFGGAAASQYSQLLGRCLPQRTKQIAAPNKTIAP